jgi:hypothetical protein
MENDKNIAIDAFCSYYRIETSFVESLNDSGLIDIQREADTWYVQYSQLAEIEKYIHLHYDLDINLEGIEAISHLLKRIDNLQAELQLLRNRLNP